MAKWLMKVKHIRDVTERIAEKVHTSVISSEMTKKTIIVAYECIRRVSFRNLILGVIVLGVIYKIASAPLPYCDEHIKTSKR